MVIVRKDLQKQIANKNKVGYYDGFNIRRSRLKDLNKKYRKILDVEESIKEEKELDDKLTKRLAFLLGVALGMLVLVCLFKIYGW